MSLIDRINTRKTDLSMTSEELSRRAEIPLGTINKILNGQSADPRISTVRKLAAALCCSIDYLAELTDDPTPITTHYPDSSAKTWLVSFSHRVSEDKAEYYRRVLRSIDDSPAK